MAIVLRRRVPKGTVDAALSYCHDNLADDTLQGLVPYLREKGVKVVSASFSSMGLLTQKASALRSNFPPTTLSTVPLYGVSSFRRPIAHARSDTVQQWCRAPAPRIAMSDMHAQAPPSWHPASQAVKEAADKARAICAEKGTDLATISLKRFMKCAALLCLATVAAQHVQCYACAAGRSSLADPRFTYPCDYAGPMASTSGSWAW